MDFGLYRDTPLRTTRLALEPLNAWHGESLFAFLKEPLLYTFQAEEPPLAASHLSRRFEAMEGRRAPDGSELRLGWAVRIATAGYAGLVEATLRADGMATLGAWTFLPFQRLGYAREALEAVLAHLRAAGAREAAAAIDTRDTAAIRLAESLGFARTDTRAMARKLRGRWADEHDYRKTL